MIRSASRWEMAIKVNLGQLEPTELEQGQTRKQLKVPIETDQSPLVRDRECRQVGIRAQPWGQVLLAHQQMKNIPAITGGLCMTDPGLLQKRLKQG